MNVRGPAGEHEERLSFVTKAALAAHFHPPPHRIVSLAFLSAHLPASLISQELARSLVAESEAAVVLVRFKMQDGKNGTGDGQQPELFLNGEFHIPTRVSRTEAGFYALTLGVRNEDPPSPAGVASLISHLSRHFRYVLIETPAEDRPASWL